jgi:3-deoxy-D-manno-octulosonic-acid transferase
MTALAWYGAAASVIAPLLRLRFAWRARSERGYGEHVSERYGRYAPDVAASLATWRMAPGPRLWVHAVSLGETRAAAALVDALRTRLPTLRVLWTHGTATGRQAGAGLLQPGDLQLWQPLDAPRAVGRFFDAVRPTVGVLMETEIWPQLLAEAQRRQIPMLLANARLSERSAQRGQRWRALMQPAVQSLACVLAQTADDARRLVAAGARPGRVQVCGNLKFDMNPPPEKLALGRAWQRTLQGRPVVLFASSREGEEAPLLAAWQAQVSSPGALPAELARRGNPRPLLLIVPRHPQRFDEVARLASGCGLQTVRRSAWGESTPDAAATLADVWVGDSVGEMPAYYALASVALLGGSFAPLGGQNLIEAAACGCPVITGPHTFNFADAAERAVLAGAAVRVPDVGAAVQAALSHVRQQATGTEGSPQAGALPATRAQALAFAAAHQGAALRMALAVASQLER